MIVLMVNKACEWCQIATETGTYTCPIKRIDGGLFFKFKREWHSVANYILESAHELVYVGNKLVNRGYTG